MQRFFRLHEEGSVIYSGLNTPKFKYFRGHFNSYCLTSDNKSVMLQSFIKLRIKETITDFTICFVLVYSNTQSEKHVNAGR